MEKRLYEIGYKLPIRFDSYKMYAFDADKNMAFQSADFDGTAKLPPYFSAIINGDVNAKPNNDYTFDGEYILFKGERMLLLRGWGHLIGIGGLNLPDEKANEIQQDFGSYLIERLTGK